MDITSLVALPVWIMMPFSMLQNISEIMEYTDRLEKAAQTEDPYERCTCSHHALLLISIVRMRGYNLQTVNSMILSLLIHNSKLLKGKQINCLPVQCGYWLLFCPGWPG